MAFIKESPEAVFECDITSPTKKAKHNTQADSPVEWIYQQLKLLSYLRHKGKSWKCSSREIIPLIPSVLMCQFPRRSKSDMIKAYKENAKMVNEVFDQEVVQPSRHIRMRIVEDTWVRIAEEMGKGVLPAVTARSREELQQKLPLVSV
jgi:hypothetical protein